MKRRLFFLLEKLKIAHRERRAVFILLMVLVLLASANVVVTSSNPLHQKKYAELNRHFKAQTAKMKRENTRLLARYHGQKLQAAVTDSLPRDSTKQADHSQKKSRVDSELININTANAKTLQTLSGIGGAYARRIIRYRRQHGAFTRRDELKKINGIGPKTLQSIKPHITVGEQEDVKKSRETKTAQLKHDAKRESTPSNEASEATFIINVNTADAESLEKLTGVGSVYAERIVVWRRQNGAFASKDELLNIKGIGKKRLAKIKPFIKLTASQ